MKTLQELAFLKLRIIDMLKPNEAYTRSPWYIGMISKPPQNPYIIPDMISRAGEKWIIQQFIERDPRFERMWETHANFHICRMFDFTNELSNDGCWCFCKLGETCNCACLHMFFSLVYFVEDENGILNYNATVQDALTAWRVF